MKIKEYIQKNTIQKSEESKDTQNNFKTPTKTPRVHDKTPETK